MIKTRCPECSHGTWFFLKEISSITPNKILMDTRRVGFDNRGGIYHENLH